MQGAGLDKCQALCPTIFQVKYTLRTCDKNHRKFEENKLTRSYEDGIMDCLKIMNNYRMSGIYDIPIKYIEEAINKLLTSDQKLDQNDINAQS